MPDVTARFDNATLHHGDCLDLLPAILVQDGPFDHVIADPPYEDALHEAAAKGSIARTDGRREPRGPQFAGISELSFGAAVCLRLPPHPR